MNKREMLGLALYNIGRLCAKRQDFLSLYFHNPGTDLFGDILGWCHDRGYRFIDLRECHDILTNKTPQRDKVVYLSFDDGWRSNLDLIPIAEKYQAPITIFVAVEPLLSGNYWWEYATAKGTETRDAMKRMAHQDFLQELDSLKRQYRLGRSALTEQELVRIAAHPLVDIGSHTVTHPILTNCSDETLRRELCESKARLEELTNHEITAFSYPNGDFTGREVEAVRQAGYELAFSTRHEAVHAGGTDLYSIPRMAMNTYGGRYENLSKVLGVWQRVVR